MENISLYKEELSEECAKYISPQTKLKMWKSESWTPNWVRIQMISPPWWSAFIHRFVDIDQKAEASDKNCIRP